MSIHKLITLAGLALVLAAAGPAVAGAEAAGGERTVKGRASGTDRINIQTLEISADITAILSHLGKATAHLEADGALTPAGTVAASGPFTIAAANGDQLTGTFTLAGPPPSLGFHTIDVVLTITGGSGRFSDASGELTTTQEVTPQLPFVPPILRQASEGTVQGRISY